MSNKATTFHIGDLLSVTTDRLVSPTKMDGVYQLLNHMTQVSLMTHQLPRASKVCAPYLFEQHPWLSGVTPPEKFLNADHVWAWVADTAVEHGEYHTVEPLPVGVYTPQNPIGEFIDMKRGNNEGSS